ncbi:hypothetical protein [Cohnella yongneupensis]|uniref:Replication protein n=1 Tax=Cohnella yongneupensis TaxID=425006 RepID=A0ABW0R1M0_9BACL
MAKKKKYKDYSFKPFELSPGKRHNHARITYDMMDSKAWNQLSIYAIGLYLAMKKKFNGGNEHDISFTYAEGQKLMAKKTFTKALDQLIEVGLIDLNYQGRYVREPNIYGFSCRWQQYGTDSFVAKQRRKRVPDHD